MVPEIWLNKDFYFPPQITDTFKIDVLQILAQGNQVSFETSQFIKAALFLFLFCFVCSFNTISFLNLIIPVYKKHLLRFFAQFAGRKVGHMEQERGLGEMFFHSSRTGRVLVKKNWNRNPIPINTSWIALMQPLSYVYTLRLIGPISYPGKCDLMIHTRKHSVIFSRMHLLPSFAYNMHQDTKSARLIAVCKRTFTCLTLTHLSMC